MGSGIWERAEKSTGLLLRATALMDAAGAQQGERKILKYTKVKMETGEKCGGEGEMRQGEKLTKRSKHGTAEENWEKQKYYVSSEGRR